MFYNAVLIDLMIYTEYTTLWQLDSSFKCMETQFLLFPFFFIFENMLLH